jgi:tryptophanyl-tRNA synthetase
MRQNYLGGNYGYGHAKQALFELILEEFKSERARFDELMSNPSNIESLLLQGAEKAQPIANEVLSRFKTAIGF